MKISYQKTEVMALGKGYRVLRFYISNGKHVRESQKEGEGISTRLLQTPTVVIFANNEKN